MAHETVTFNGGLAFAGTQAVYLKQRWADEEWVLNESLYATQVVWTAQPTLPVATLYRSYGPARERDSFTPASREKLSIPGWFVKIVVTCADGPRVWYGYVEMDTDDEGGVVSVGEDFVATGTQTFQCIGIIGLLMHTLVEKTPFLFRLDLEEEEILLSSLSVVKYGDSGPVFNEIHNGWPIPNKSFLPRSREEDGEESRVFEPIVLYGNDSPTSDDQGWSTRDIIQHLYVWHPPLNAAGEVKIPYSWADLTLLPNDDRPTIATDKRSLLSIFDELCTGRLMMGYYATVEEADPEEEDSLDKIVLHPYSLLTDDVTVGDTTVAKNPNTLDITYIQDQSTRASSTLDLSQRANQVIARGARKITVVTLPFRRTATTEIPKVFTPVTTLADCTTPPTATSDPYVNQGNRIEWLNHCKNKMYLRGYKFDTAWNWQLNHLFIFKNWVLDPEEEEPTLMEEQYFPNPYGLKLLDRLPFREGFNYIDAEKNFDRGGNGKYLEPIVFGHKLYYDGTALKVKNADGDEEFMLFNGRKKLDMMVGLDQIPYDIKFSPLEKDGILGVYFDIGTHPENLADEAISETALTPRDESPHISRYNRSDLYATVAFEEDRSLEVRYPPDEELADVDGIRRRILEFGDAMQHVTILDGTTVNVREGLRDQIEGDTYLRDDTDKLQILAQQSYRYYSQDRRVLNLFSHRASSVIDIGKMVLKTNPSTSLEKPINTVVTQVAISFRPGSAQGVQPCDFNVVTAAGEFDYLHFLPRRAMERVTS